MATAKEISETLVARMEERTRDPGTVWGVPYFSKGLNALTGGAHRGEMSLLGARTSVGKSFFLAQNALSVAHWLKTAEGQKRCPNAVVKLVLREMSAAQFQQRLIVQTALVSDRKVRQGRLSFTDQRKYRQAAHEVGELPIEYEDNPKGLAQTLTWLDEGAPCAWFGVDYIGILPTGFKDLDGNQYRRVGYLSEGFRDYCLHGPPGLILAQLNRQIEMRKPEERKPQLSDFRDSGTLEQDASGVILTLFRPDLYSRVSDEEASRPKPAELAVLKQRNGPIGVIEMQWVPNLPGFVDVSDVVDDIETRTT